MLLDFNIIISILACSNNCDVIEFLLLLSTFNNRIVSKSDIFKRYKAINRYSSKTKLVITFNKLFNSFTQITKLTNRPVLCRISNELYHVKSVYTSLKFKSAHGSAMNVIVNDKSLREYKSLYSLCKTASLYLLYRLCMFCNNAQFDWTLIRNIFGLSKHFVKKYFSTNAVSREIGPVEAKDCNLDYNLFGKRNYYIQHGFTLDIDNEINFKYHTDVDVRCLSSMIEQLEHKHYSLCKGDVFTAPRERLVESSHRFALCRLITGYKSGSGYSCASSYIKRIAEIHNLGQYKSISNIHRTIFSHMKCTDMPKDIQKAIVCDVIHYYSTINNYQYNRSDKARL